KGKWSLMGGFLKKEETLDEAAQRVLSNLTGFKKVYLEQLRTYSKIDRDPEERTLSTAYYALIDIAAHNEHLIEQYSAKWFSLKKAPKLIFDHDIMVEQAIARLRRRTKSQPIGFELLPQKFTMRQLKSLYESILDTKLDKRNFINRVNSLDILKKLDEKDMSASRKGSYLYQFDKVKFDQKLEDGFNFKI